MTLELYADVTVSNISMILAIVVFLLESRILTY